MEFARQFELSGLTVQANTAGLTHEDSVKTPAGGGNCLNWVLGHILWARNRFFPLVRLDPFWAEPPAQYERGAATLDEAAALPLADLLEEFGRSQEQLLPRLKELDEKTLAQRLPDGPHPILGETIGSALTALAWHEGYHAGQIGILRRVAGKEGALA